MLCYPYILPAWARPKIFGELLLSGGLLLAHLWLDLLLLNSERLQRSRIGVW